MNSRTLKSTLKLILCALAVALTLMSCSDQTTTPPLIETSQQDSTSDTISDTTTEVSIDSVSDTTSVISTDSTEESTGDSACQMLPLIEGQIFYQRTYGYQRIEIDSTLICGIIYAQPGDTVHISTNIPALDGYSWKDYSTSPNHYSLITNSWFYEASEYHNTPDRYITYFETANSTGESYSHEFDWRFESETTPIVVQKRLHFLIRPE